MTTIRPYAAGAYVTQRNTQQILDIKSQLAGLTTQLSTGRTAETYGGLGVGRTTSLSARATISALDGYDASIGYGDTRAKLASASLSQVIGLATSLDGNLKSGMVRSSSGTISSATLARDSLDAALNALNQAGAGTYIFGGRDNGTEPVLGIDTILNGDGTKAGVAQLVKEQVLADLGKDGMGRLGTTLTGSRIGLAETGSPEVRANFGFLIADKPTVTGNAIAVTYTAGAPPTATPAFNAVPQEGQTFRVVVNQQDGSQKTVDFVATSADSGGDLTVFKLPVASAAAAATQLAALVAPGRLASVQGPTVTVGGAAQPLLDLTVAGGTPASFDLDLTAQPVVGDSVTIRLALHDGTTTAITLTARAATTGATAGTFAIDPADPAKTAQNLKAALDTAVTGAAGSSLTAAATVRAADDFFDGTALPGLEARRLTFDPATGEATGYARTPRSDTVQWYRGEDSATDPRAAAVVRTGADSTVQLGVRANEAPLRSVLAGMAAVVLGTPASTDANANAKWQAMADRTGPLVRAANTNPSVQEIVTDLSLATSAMAGAKAQNGALRTVLQNAMDGVESADTTEVTTKLLDLQNRLQASYQVTATLSKLSLVNYMN